MAERVQETNGPTAPDRSTYVGWGVALVTIGMVWLLLALDVAVPWDLVLPGALIAIGLLVLVGGRRLGGEWAINLGIWVGIVALLVAFVPGVPDLSVGERDLTYTGLDELPDEHALGVGSMTIDLRALELPIGTTELRAGVSVGELRVVLPEDVAISGRAEVAIGEITQPGSSRGGLGRSLEWEASPEDERVLQLELGVGVGRIEVRR